MKITYLIGNGFDINIGLNTRYRDFYEYYKNTPSNGVHVENLKKEIDKNYNNWADLEAKLGDYTKEFTSEDDFEFVFEDIQEKLAQYIANEENKYQIEKNELACNIFRKDLHSPENHLPRADKERIGQYKENWSTKNCTIDIITFNYSNSIDRLLNNTDKILQKRGNGTTYSYQKIEHIHGYHNDRMILGVNDPLQIANETFRSSQRITDALIKPQCNSVQKHFIDKDCQQIINESNLICLFGLSLGDTDKLWWEKVGEWLNLNNGLLIIYYKSNENIHPLRGYKLGIKTNEVIDLFLSQTKLDNTQKIKCKNRIIIGYNSNLFSFSVKTDETSQ